MAAHEKDTSALLLSAFIILVAALGGYLWYQAPLKSARPSNPALEQHDAVGVKRALARLWQDPLVAVDKHRKIRRGRAGRMDDQGWPTLAEEVAARLNPGDASPNTMVLFVMTDGSPYVEGTEQRIRDRYAVGSALSVACYVPDDGDHVGYLTTDHDPTIPLAYEWYGPRALHDCAPSHATATVYDHVLVLWANDEIFGERPVLHTLANLTETLHTLTGKTYRARNPSANAVPPFAFALIGPTGSTILRSMVEEAEAGGGVIRWPPMNATQQPGVLPIFSPMATVSGQQIAQSLLGLHAGASLDADAWVLEILKHARITLPYHIPSDSALSRLLIQELQLRGVHAGSHIALLSEWDSFYGRTLPSEFVAAACIHARASGANLPCSTHGKALEALANPAVQKRLIPGIRQYSYLRGLDGELPGDDSPSEKGPRATTLFAQGGDRRMGDLERPEGESQLDYVRRLADRLEADSENRDFRAIGILGSDVYDKLLILQALRQRFPHTLFFTTDLDARLLHPSQYAWTHNLIVVSHFGLQVHPALQQAIPPFRSSYQSSTFIAVLRAVGHLQQESPDQPYTIQGDTSVAFQPTLTPLVYEVGRTAPHRLPILQQPAEPSPTGARDLEPLNSPVSASAEALATRHELAQFLLTALAVLFGLYLAIPVVQSVPDESLSGDARIFVLRTAVALAVLFGTMTAIFAWLGGRPNSEPFYWIEGISVWPSELIRLAAAILGVGFLRFAHRLLERNATRLAVEYRLQEGVMTEPLPRPGPVWEHFVSPLSWSIRFTGNARDLTRLWREHEAVARTTWRRVVPQTVLLGMVGVVLLSAFGVPHPPARGTGALVWHALASGASSLVTGLLMFYVVDAIRACTSFIHQFALEPTQWSPAVVQPWCERRKLPPHLVREWLDIRFIADRTKVVASMIHYPIVALFLMILARHRIFDDWSYPPALLLVYGVSAAYILLCAVLLSVAAEKARRIVVARLRDELYALRGQAQEPGQGDRCVHQIAQTDLMLQDVQSIRQGAFAHWTQHPVFQALLLPSGGISVLALFDYFLRQ